MFSFLTHSGQGRDNRGGCGMVLTAFSVLHRLGIFRFFCFKFGVLQGIVMFCNVKQSRGRRGGCFLDSVCLADTIPAGGRRGGLCEYLRGPEGRGSRAVSSWGQYLDLNCWMKCAVWADGSEGWTLHWKMFAQVL